MNMKMKNDTTVGTGNTALVTKELNEAANEFLRDHPAAERFAGFKNALRVPVRLREDGELVVRLRDAMPFFNAPFSTGDKNHRPVDDLMFVQGVIDRQLEIARPYEDEDPGFVELLVGIQSRVKRDEFDAVLTRTELSTIYESTEHGSDAELAEDVNQRMTAYHELLIQKYGEESPRSVLIQERSLGIAANWTPPIARHAALEIGARMIDALFKLDAVKTVQQNQD